MRRPGAVRSLSARAAKFMNLGELFEDFADAAEPLTQAFVVALCTDA